MKTTTTVTLIVFFCLFGTSTGQQAITISSPGLSPSKMSADGRLIEDWGTVDVKLSGEGITAGAVEVGPIRIEECIPAAQAVCDYGAVHLTRTVYRAPVFPAGVDVLTVSLEETKGIATDVLLTLDPSAGTKLGQRTARIGGRVVLVLPQEIVDDQPLLDWGFCDESTSLPGWAKPQGNCDPAFRNIRAGMGGVPIVYRFGVTAGSSASVVLGLCESHWADPGKRPVVCRVEGAESQTVDPVAKWGQHQPGVLAFAARDANRDGRLEISVRSAAHAADQNPILNAIWIYAPDKAPSEDQIMAGTSNDMAQYYVDVGGENDQSIFPPGKMEFPVELAAGDTQRLVFLVACPGSSAPMPTHSRWTPDTLLRAACDVWRDWKAEAE